VPADLRSWLQRPRPPLSLIDDWYLCLIFFVVPVASLWGAVDMFRAGERGRGGFSLLLAAVCTFAALAYLNRPPSSKRE
jgi:hypothetical protein